MNWNDDDDDDFFNFDYDNLSPEEKEELEKEMREKDEERENHPLFRKAEDIYETVSAFIESLEDSQEKEMHESILIQDAMMLAPKLAGAMGSESFVLSMQNAAIIRYHAESLLTQTSSLKMHGLGDEKYVQLLRKDVLEFQGLFKEWVKEIQNIDDDYEDEWGLFNREKK